MLATEYPHLTTKNGITIIENTRFKVIDIVECYLAYGWSPDEIHRQYSFLTKSQICSAMAYYHDNEQKIHEQIVTDTEEIERRRKNSKQITRAELLARIKK
ncbi:DUF433 domain-containing protein [Candidatus Uabimicrobium sp. HlEnr_7]|uniref:DUF433 domain-containing protein n=1 Tax=Candidatus Uabimicrobium helgolandensis TaxID=3095367 RepID=UPI003558D418